MKDKFMFGLKMNSNPGSYRSITHAEAEIATTPNNANHHKSTPIRMSLSNYHRYLRYPCVGLGDIRFVLLRVVSTWAEKDPT
jgi:hypothetical protein